MTSIGNYAFANCSGLTSITIPNSVTSIGERAYLSCRGLTSVTIPNSVTSIGDLAFYGCSGLTSITIPNSVTSIGDGAFYRCSGLTSITIPNSVTSIGSGAFYCSDLTSVIVGWDTPLWLDSFAFGESNNQNVILYVPKGTKAAYEAANVWKDFGSIEEYEKPQENVEATDVSAIDNVIYIDPLEVTRGTEVTVPLQMKNTAGVRGFQFDMYLPLGVTVKKDGNNRFICSLNDDRKPSGDQHTLTVNEQADGAIRFLCGSQYDETFTGTEGEILTVQLCVDEKMLAGLYPIILKNVKLTETNINNFYLTETVQTALNVIPYIPGDISGDGVIDVSDYIGVANYILGTPQAGITAAAADVNKDNLVDVSDYIGVANLILYNNIYGQTANASRRLQKRVNTDVSALNNVVYITPFETTSNSETQVSVKMKNTVGIRGFQFDLYLPEGITAKKDGNNRIVCSLNNGRKPNGDQHTLTMSEQPDGAIRFLCGSQYDETFTGTDGEIATLTISVAADVEADNYPIYLRNMKLTETDINNYYTTDEIETSVTVTGPADGRIVLDEASTTAPEAANGVDVRVKRTINANEWSTICLPFAMSATQVKAAFGDDVQLADFTSYDIVEDTGENVVGLTVNFNMVTAIEANHPYVIKVSNAISEFTADNVTIDPEEEPCVEYDNGLTGKKRVVWGSFTGTYVADCVIPYEGDDVSLFLSGNKWWYATAQTKHMKGYRAYFWFTDLLPDVSASRIQMAFNDETANVVELKDGRMEELKSYYNLKGQRVEKPLKKGLYIRNGKKVIIK